VKIIIILACLIWQSIYLFYATRIYFKKKVKKPIAIKYGEVSLRQQLMIIGVMAELLQAGIDPLSVIKSGIETLDDNQRQKYLDQLSGKQINDRDHLTSSIDLILKSSISGSKIAEI
jgi:NADH:ubiquinone oxidoreductase subunit 4 (subunit M)